MQALCLQKFSSILCTNILWYVSIMSNCELLARITTDRVSAAALTYRFLLLAVTLLSLDFLLAYPVFAQQPLYIGDFDGPLDRNEYRPPVLNRVDLFDGNPFAPQELVPPRRPPNMVPQRAKGVRRYSQSGEEFQRAIIY